MYLCTDIGIQCILRNQLLANAPDLILDMCFFFSTDTALHVDSQIIVLKYANCQNLHVYTTLAINTSKHIQKCSVYGKNYYENQVVSGNSLVQQQLYVLNLPDAKSTTTFEKSRYDEICNKFLNVF